MRFHTPETVKNFNRVYLDVIFENPLLLKLVKARIVSPSMLAQSIAFFDGLAMVLTGLIAKELYVGNDFTGDNDQWGGYYVTIGIAVSLFLLIASHHGEYNVKKLNSLTWQLGSVLSISVAAFALTFAVLFFLKVSAQFSRVWFATWSVSSVASLFLARTFFAFHIRHLMRAGMLRKAVALIGSGEQFKRLAEGIAADGQQFKIIRHTEVAESGAEEKTARAEIADFVRDLQHLPVDEILVSVPASQGKLLETIIREVQLLPADVQVLPDLGGADIQILGLTRTGPFELIKTVSKPLAGWSVFVKAAEDYSIALIALLLTLPAMLLIALFIKLDSPGPVFFRQRRHGYNHRVIEVLKFRTMTVLDDGDVIKQATRGDTRVTRVGRFLRRTSLDELPQLINVLRGEMSIVGPRPHALAHNTYYGRLIENYANRHRVKPGMTGWAQVHGFRGETHDPAMMAERIKYDLQYIERWSLWLDFKIIIMTPLFGLFRNSAF